jgi:hypothetical protein
MKRTKILTDPETEEIDKHPHKKFLPCPPHPAPLPTQLRGTGFQTNRFPALYLHEVMVTYPDLHHCAAIIHHSYWFQY